MTEHPEIRPDDATCVAALSALAQGGTLPAVHRAHFAGCESCREIAAALSSVSAPPDAGEDEDCPPYETWLRLSAGLEDAEESDRLLEHAASCDSCGAALKAAGEDLDSPARPVVVPAKRFISFRILPYAAAALIVCGYLYWSSRPKVETLIGRAYAANRPAGFRLADAQYGPVAPMERAAGTPSIDLLRAETIVLEGLKDDPNNRRLLILRSRVDLLRRRYDAAVSTLEGMVDSNAAPALLIDLGIAYLARSSTGSDKEDSVRAIEYLTRAWEKDPRHEVILFNRAMAQESLSLWDGARRDWERYLELEPPDGWAAEAREHLDRIVKKKMPGPGG